MDAKEDTREYTWPDPPFFRGGLEFPCYRWPQEDDNAPWWVPQTSVRQFIDSNRVDRTHPGASRCRSACVLVLLWPRWLRCGSGSDVAIPCREVFFDFVCLDAQTLTSLPPTIYPLHIHTTPHTRALCQSHPIHRTKQYPTPCHSTPANSNP